MACNESDDKLELLNEIRMLEDEVAGLEEKMYHLAFKKKMLNHQIDDIKYMLKTKGSE